MSCIRAASRLVSLRHISVVHALRAASSLPRTHYSQQRQQRSFSSTPRQEAQSPSGFDAFAGTALNNPLIQELAGKPEVVQAMKDLIHVMQDEGASAFRSGSLCSVQPIQPVLGFAFDPANPPSTMKLLMNSKVRSQLLNTYQVLQASGIDEKKLKVRSPY